MFGSSKRSTKVLFHCAVVRAEGLALPEGTHVSLKWVRGESKSGSVVAGVVDNEGTVLWGSPTFAVRTTFRSEAHCKMLTITLHEVRLRISGAVT